MASTTTSPRKRLSPEESRIAALEAARDLLLEAGPQAVTGFRQVLEAMMDPDMRRQFQGLKEGRE